MVSGKTGDGGRGRGGEDGLRVDWAVREGSPGR